mmetsp:Transcript_14421/g.2363  ORF Transcript_14421/g.2363 Transcript_14421/m.2363 type:complete len:96 (+) Transcript_14421:80-367(+)
MFVAEYKGINYHPTIVNLFLKPSWFLRQSSTNLVPLLNIYRKDGVYTINDSMPIAQYFDSYSGPAVYPREENGGVCPLKRALIDNLILNCNEPIT